MKDYYERVKQILIAKPDTRDDDMKLYAYMVYSTVGLKPSVGFYEAVFHHSKYNLPSYESVTRARRKVQENEPTLRGEKYLKRLERQEEYRQYYSDN